jgi:RNA polymerase sigma factor FliA
MTNTNAALRTPTDTPSSTTEVIERHVPLAKSIVARIRQSHGLSAPFDDLYSLGLGGLMQAAERFDPARGVSFATFAYYRIRGAVLDGLRRDPELRLADPLRSSAADRPLPSSAIPANDNGRAGATSPPPRDEPRWLLLDPSAVHLLSPESIDELADEYAAHPDEEIERKRLAERLRTAISALPEPERQIVELHYYDDLSFSEIGARLGVCEPWAFRLHNKAIERLREMLGDLGDDLLTALGA